LIILEFEIWNPKDGISIGRTEFKTPNSKHRIRRENPAGTNGNIIEITLSCMLHASRLKFCERIRLLNSNILRETHGIRRS
jgi:hypothetical protein